MSGRAIFDALGRVWHRQRPPGPTPVERCYRPTTGRFNELRAHPRPVRIDGLLDEWPAAARITLARLKERFGDRRLPILAIDEGRLVVDVDRGVAFDALRLGDYLDRLASSESVDGYLAAPVDRWLPEVAEEMPPPTYCRDAPWRNSRLWLSAAQTAVPLHRDVAQNIFVQLEGRKRFLLYPPGASHWLYSHRFRSALPNYSQFDPERPDYEQFPLSRGVEPLEVVLGPGEAMYLPSRWWHQVRSLDLSLSINFWWAEGVVALAVRAAEFVKRMRGLEIYGLERRLRAQHAIG